MNLETICIIFFRCQLTHCNQAISRLFQREHWNKGAIFTAIEQGEL